MKIKLAVGFYKDASTWFEAWQFNHTKAHFLKLPFVGFELHLTRKKKVNVE